MANLGKTPNSVLPSKGSTPAPRARVACKACNSRRVKCDAGSGQPCWHCRIRDTPCELIESRRGKYVRKKQHLDRGQQSRRPQEPTNTSAYPETSAITCSQRDTVGSLESARVEDHDMLFAGTTGAERTPSAQSNSQPGHLEDSANLTYTIEVDYASKSGSTERLKVQYPVPTSVADRTFNHGPGAEALVPFSDAFAMPVRHIADGLIRAFFDVVHPAYPVFSRKSFTRLYLQGQASPLVLHTIFFMGFTVSPDSLIHASGYSDRTIARKTHYLRAKMLYDADYEEDRLNVAAALLLFGFWWSGPEDQKDFCYWIGCATDVAQSLGMHCSSSQSGMSQPVRSLRKRIWWSIYIRDRHTAAAFGRPCRIRDEDCDIEPLTEDDFQFDSDCDQSLIPAQKDFHPTYTVEMSKLAIILGDILVAEFSPRRAASEKFDIGALANRLTQWESELPDQLRGIPPDGSLGASFWSRMLYSAYHNYHILLFRPKAIDNLSPTEAERDVRARIAADSITRIAEDLLATGTIKLGQIHLIPALFGALSVHTMIICRKDPIRQKLAENKSRQCLLALSELSISWPVRIWFAKAFVNLMRRLTSRGGSIVNVSSSIARTSSNLASQGQFSSFESHRGISLDEISPRTDGNNLLSDRLHAWEPSAQSASFDDSHNAQSYSPQIADQVMYDSFLAGYLDNTFDPDLLLYSSLGPILPLSVGGSAETGKPSYPGT
ncbi:fungal-specific transcription factor domain-containing protein [Aspergillus cavernicola]|uniref:Fungal-specific transcription factor domain-containing protein n=1 Tax=Aspergillus cavernicola TaxID=176166 RepID=A0ABR4HSP2_9EURO